MQETIFGQKKDAYFMEQALEQAQHACALGEVPIGAIVVDSNGTIIGAGFNQVEQCHTQSAHAEVYALTQAGKTIADWRLTGCWLYVTLEPCSMCMALIRLSRLQGMVFGADSPLFGYRLDNIDVVSVYNKDPLLTVSGVHAEKSRALLKDFFKQKRKEG
jgi:tRNA(adenine34) deaminase